MNLWHLYWEEDIPMFLFDGMRGGEMSRLHGVGMNCGCEYTSFPLFRSIRKPYTRHDHSVGAALLTWRFTRDPAQAFAALFHDIATPCFAHVVDFMCGDYMRQESTEAKTRGIIADSECLQILLKHYGYATDDVADYHRYPIADNDSPRLSADRLEYTCGNLVNFGRRTEAEIKDMLDDLTVGKNEDNEDEIMFRSKEKAQNFAQGALEMGRIYVSDEDRFAMQALAVLLKEAIEAQIITMKDLWTEEDRIIQKLCADPEQRSRWEYFRGFREIVRGREDGIRIPAKKRFIDPLVLGEGRVSALDAGFREALGMFLDESQDVRLTGISGGFSLEEEEKRMEEAHRRWVDEMTAKTHANNSGQGGNP